jgi:hypothetical protein
MKRSPHRPPIKLSEQVEEKKHGKFENLFVTRA